MTNIYKKIPVWCKIILLPLTAIVAVSLVQYLMYIFQIVSFPYEWGPSDGDHINFAYRMKNGLPTYLDFGNGEILNIYNPLYYILINIFSFIGPDMVVARSISLFSWLGAAVVIGLYYYKRLGAIGIVGAILALLPAKPGMLLDLVDVTPSTTMGLFFVLALMAFDRNVLKQENKIPQFCLIGILAGLCFLAKQHGIVAIVSIVCFMALQRKGLKALFVVGFGFLIPIIAAIVYFQFYNSEQYLQNTLFGLNDLMITMPGLASERMMSFLSHSLALVVCLILSYAFVVTRHLKITVWHVSFIVHIPMLLKVLGNGGGGPNYFITFWFTMIIICVQLIHYLFHNVNITAKLYSALKIKATGMFLPNILLILFVANQSIAALHINRQIQYSNVPSEHLTTVMQNYYDAVGELVLNYPDVMVLTNRNIGAYIANKLNVENEGSTMFQYAWAHPNKFDKDIILKRVSGKEYDFIAEGLQPYPSDVQQLISDNYEAVLTKELGVYLGNIMQVNIYAPKSNIQ